MKLEVYPTYAEKLNVIARTDSTKRGIWGEVVKRAARLMETNGDRLCYPQRPVFFPDRDPEVRDALVRVNRAANRARWVYLSIAAREILQGLKPFVVLLLALALLAAVAPPASAAGSTGDKVYMNVVPNAVNRYDVFTITITTLLPNASFDILITGRNGFSLDLFNRTDARGFFSMEQSAYFDYGQYEVRASVPNATVAAFLTVGCDAACTVDILQSGNLQTQLLVYGEAEKWGLFALFLLVAFEFPKAAAFFHKIGREAKKRGDYTPREWAAAPFTLMRSHINPGDQVADPKNPQNARIAIDRERRRLTEQLHEITAKKFMGWRPDNLAPLKEVVADLESAWRREAEIAPAPSLISRSVVVDGAKQKAEAEKMLKQAKELDEELGRTARLIEKENGGRPRVDRTLRASKWALLLLGIPSLAMALLVSAAYAGVHVDALRWAWVAFPDDSVKMLGGSLVFVATVFAYTGARLRQKKA